MSVIDDLVRNNDRYAKAFAEGDLAAAPALKLAVLACMDARIDVLKILGLEEGQAHVIRNAGGLATEDAIRSLIISHRLLGTEHVMLIHHTDCGMLKFTDEGLKAQLIAECGHAPPFDMGAVTDLEEGLRSCIREIENNPFIDYKDVRGFIYDVTSGALSEITV